MVFTDPDDRLTDGSGHTGAGALGGRADSSIATTEPDCARQLADEEVAFGVRLGSTRRVAPGPRLLDVFFDLREAPAIGILGSFVEDRSGVTERRGRDLRAHIARRWHVHFSRDQIDDVDFPVGVGEKARDVTRTLEVPHPHRVTIEGDGPVVSLAPKDVEVRGARLVLGFELGFESNRDDDGTARWFPDSNAFEDRAGGAHLQLRAAFVAPRAVRVRKSPLGDCRLVRSANLMP
jgi:hypothetical protein